MSGRQQLQKSSQIFPVYDVDFLVLFVTAFLKNKFVFSHVKNSKQRLSMNLLQGWKVGEYHFDILQFWLRQEYGVDHNYISE